MESVHCLGVGSSLRSMGKGDKFISFTALPQPLFSHSITPELRAQDPDPAPNSDPTLGHTTLVGWEPEVCQLQRIGQPIDGEVGLGVGSWELGVGRMNSMCVLVAATTITQVMTPYLNSKMSQRAAE